MQISVPLILLACCTDDRFGTPLRERAACRPGAAARAATCPATERVSDVATTSRGLVASSGAMRSRVTGQPTSVGLRLSGVGQRTEEHNRDADYSPQAAQAPTPRAGATP